MSVRRRGEFYKTTGWLTLRKQRLAYAHYQCECCASPEDLQLDHIFARANGSHRRLGLHEVQILCRRCNQAKGTMELTASQLRDLLGIDPRNPLTTTPWAVRSIYSRKPRVG
jgi:5-methylcytosine-specific restriction endonuclease McrA